MSKQTAVAAALPGYDVKVMSGVDRGRKGTIANVRIEDVVLLVFVADDNHVSEQHFADIVKSYVSRVVNY